MIFRVKSSDFVGEIQLFLAFLKQCLAYEHQRLCDILERTATISSFTNAENLFAVSPFQCEHERTYTVEERTV